MMRNAHQVRRAIAAAVASVVVAATIGCGPLGPVPGGRLRGEPTPVPSSFAAFADAHTAQLETRPDAPHSVNVWLGVVDARLFLATSLIRGTDVPAERDWVKHVLADPRVRLRVDGRLYELRAKRVVDSQLVEQVRAAMIEKYDVEVDAHSSAAWIFELGPRS